jgi:hypothetical protein
MFLAALRVQALMQRAAPHTGGAVALSGMADRGLFADALLYCTCDLVNLRSKELVNCAVPCVIVPTLANGG